MRISDVPAVLVLLVGAVLVVSGIPTVAAAAEPPAPAPDQVAVTVTVEPPEWSRPRTQVRFAVARTPHGGQPAPWAGAVVVWQRSGAQGWERAGSARTDQRGEVVARVRPGRLRVLVEQTPETSAAVVEIEVPGAAPVHVRLAAPGRIRADQQARLRVSTSGLPDRRARVVLQTRTPQGWKPLRRTQARGGNAVLRHRPRYDTRYRARVVMPADGRTRAFVSPVARVRVAPTVAPLRLPPGAPEPRRKLPPQPRATQGGPAPVITGINDRTWRSMVGRSWRPGCPVGRKDLRLLRINYYGFDGYRHRGEIVAHRSAVHTMARALSLMHQHRVRIRSMYRVDRFGWSARLQGADDYASMAAGNTSAFNCRGVVGRPSRRSPHSYGRALDVNPWENPYLSPADGWVPNRWFQRNTMGVQTWRSGDALVVRLMRSAGMRWTYGTMDSHHFDG